MNGRRTCSYNESTKKRGLPAGYVRAMETILGLVFCHVEGSEELVSSLLSAEEDLPADLRLPDPSLTSPSARSLLDAWRKSKVVKQMERLLLVAESAEDDEAFMQRFDDRLAHVFSITSERSQAQIGNDNLRPSSNGTSPPPNEHDEMIDDTQHHIGAMAMEMPDLHESESTFVTLLSDPSPVKEGQIFPRLPPHWSQLLDVYFANTHCWFPISQKHDLLRPAYMLANGSPDQDNTPAPGESSFLWAVFAYTSHQCNASKIQVSKLYIILCSRCVKEFYGLRALSNFELPLYENRYIPLFFRVFRNS
jgi:hypothetical protein